MVSLISENVRTDCPQQRQRGSTCQRGVIRHSDDFRHYQYTQAQLKPRKLAQSSKDPVNPMLFEQPHSFALQEAREVAAVALLFSDE